ncbi:dihydroorotate dehydrogenase [Peptacetobacter hominis]|uniref:Dihydroorotate dehydrogenase n=1 Tax=Peptacetobacter hominis TaxID=2743610 RepID=A0A544QWR6_9FIRM|nr:dihydroorotate dehydrogenase [Peptacetobacter hominis]TQQ85123.1 dihydroorotate dehydrogenase [Peptacetobacter hominis]
MADLRVKFGDIEFKNPIIMASGTFGFGKEYNEYYDVNELGGISSKGLTLNAKPGNNGLRIYETPSGIMNSVGLENPGVQGFIDHEMPFFGNLKCVRIANVGGGCLEDYVKGVELLNDQDIDIVELNISCPNVKAGGMAFGIKNEVAREVVREVRKVCKHPLVVKLSPNAEDIVGMAKVCEEEGADGVSLVNTFKALAIDIKRRKPVFENVTAGLSGPAIKPIALRMVYEVSQAVNIPVIGMGGISSAKDILEFIMAGATLVQLGTVNFMNPEAGIQILKELEELMDSEGIKNLDEIRGII